MGNGASGGSGWEVGEGRVQPAGAGGQEEGRGRSRRAGVGKRESRGQRRGIAAARGGQKEGGGVRGACQAHHERARQAQSMEARHVKKLGVRKGSEVEERKFHKESS